MDKFPIKGQTLRVREGEDDYIDEEEMKEAQDELVSGVSGQGAPSICLLISNMFELSDPRVKSEPTFFQDIEDQILDECESVGQVNKVWADQKSNGNIYVKFEQNSLQGSIEAQRIFNTRMFDDREIKASYIAVVVFNTKVERS